MSKLHLTWAEAKKAYTAGAAAIALLIAQGFIKGEVADDITRVLGVLAIFTATYFVPKNQDPDAPVTETVSGPQHLEH